MVVEAINSNAVAQDSPVSSQPGGPSSIDGDTKFSSMTALKEKAPVLYKTIMEGLGMGLCQRMRRNQERSSQLKKEYQRNA